MDDTEARRIARIHEGLIASLGDPDVWQANFGSLEAGLMRVAVRLDEWIHRGLSQGQGKVSLDLIGRLLPTIDMNVRVVRAIDRLMQVALRHGASNKAPTPSNPQKPR